MSEAELLQAIWLAQRKRPAQNRGMSARAIGRHLGIGEERARDLIRAGLASGQFRRVTRTMENLRGYLIQTVGYEAIRQA